MAPKRLRKPWYPNRRSSKIKKTIVKEKPNKPIQREKFIFLRCPICFNYFGTSPVSATCCGHVFCTACLVASLITRPKCPICQKSLSQISHQILYLDTLVDDDDL